MKKLKIIILTLGFLFSTFSFSSVFLRVASQGALVARRPYAPKLARTMFSFAQKSSAIFPALSESALVVVDMQKSFISWEPNEFSFENEKKFKATNKEQERLMHFALENEIPIVLIKYAQQGPIMPKLHSLARGYDRVKIFEKNTNGAFNPLNSGKKELTSYLQKQGVNNLIVAGANGGSCVRSTIQGALVDGYSVVACSDAIIDFNYEKFKYPFEYSAIPSSFLAYILNDVCAHFDVVANKGRFKFFQVKETTQLSEKLAK